VVLLDTRGLVSHKDIFLEVTLNPESDG
jgi:hypothetical protein